MDSKNLDNLILKPGTVCDTLLEAGGYKIRDTKKYYTLFEIEVKKCIYGEDYLTFMQLMQEAGIYDVKD